MFVSIPKTQTSRSSAIDRSLWAMGRAATHPQKNERRAIAGMVYADPLVKQIVEKGAIAPATTGTSGWASQLTQNLVTEFMASLAPLSAAAALISRGVKVPMGSAATIKLPARDGAPSTATPWVAEGAPIPAREYVLNADCELVAKKFGLLVGISREAATRSNGESVVRQLLREDAAASLDGGYFSDDAASASDHPGMLDGVAPLAGFAGGDRVAMEEDLTALSDVVSAAGSGELVFIVSPRRANRIKIRYTDLSRELEFLPSLAIADDAIVAVDPLSWAHGFSDDFEIDASIETLLHMDSEPLPTVDSSAAAPARSYFQTDALALRLLANVAFAPRRPNAVAHATGLTW